MSNTALLQTVENTIVSAEKAMEILETADMIGSFDLGSMTCFVVRDGDERPQLLIQSSTEHSILLPCDML